MKNNENIMLSIIYLTYNVEDYVQQAMDSFLNQKTNFYFEIVVHDDASKDNTVKILQEYKKKFPDKIKLILQKENQHSKCNWPDDIILNYCSGKYIAFCDGDDYWCDENKLQTQVDFLESNHDYSLCAHAAQMTKEDGSYIEGKKMRPFDHDTDVDITDILAKWLFGTSSLVFRSSSRGKAPIPYRGDSINNDFALTAYLAFNGKVRYIDKTMSIYRTLAKNSTNVRYMNLEKNTLQNEKFAEMVKRMDKYSNYKYHKILSTHYNNILYGTLLKYPNFKLAKKANIFNKITLLSKLKLKLKLDIFPSLNNRKHMWDE